MIKKIQIQNFKSVQDLELDLGRLNVFIGENGCGKTNILEGIAMGSAAVDDKLSNEFLFTRGVRLTTPELMQSAFIHFPNRQIELKMGFVGESGLFIKSGIINEDNKWQALFSVDESVDFWFSDSVIVKEPNLIKFDQHLKSPIVHGLENFYDIRKKIIKETCLAPFLIYTPENSKLRRFEDEGQILPLGIGGEGLFRHIVELSRKHPASFASIKKNLEIIDWFDDLEIPTDLMFTERRLNIKDRFIHPDLQFFDQRSANEGFLYLLFYFTLFISESTPNFFAIDNIDNALNPKLCIKLIQTLSKLSKEHNKQAIVTTHNPSILDGLDLSDDDQRLFVIYRNADGHTTAKRVLKKESLNGSDSVRLSEAFIRGYLGGLPKNF